MQYDQMDQDSEINAALDIIAEFSSQSDTLDRLPYDIHFNDEVTETELNLIKGSLKKWARMNKINRRTWRMFRSTLKYGINFL